MCNTFFKKIYKNNEKSPYFRIKLKIKRFFKFFVDTIISFCYNQIVAETSNRGGIPKSGWRDRSWKPEGRVSGAGVRIPFPPPLKFIYRGMEQLGSSPGS